MITFKEAFEELAPLEIAAAWDFCGRSPKVERLWVYHSQEDGGLSCVPYFLIDGRYVEAYRVSQVLPEVDSSPGAQNSMFDALEEPWMDAVESVEPADTIPNRAVLEFTTATSEMNADFYYGQLQPGVPEDEQVPDATLADRWFERLASTGNSSATMS